MIAQFTLIPLGTKTDSVSEPLAKAFKHIVDSGLSYKVGPMGTAIEGDWDSVMKVINLCRNTLLNEVPRVMINMSIDDRKGSVNPITSKVESLEKKMGTKLRK